MNVDNSIQVITLLVKKQILYNYCPFLRIEPIADTFCKA